MTVSQLCFKPQQLSFFCTSSPPLDLQKLVNKAMRDVRSSSSIPGSARWALMLPQGLSALDGHTRALKELWTEGFSYTNSLISSHGSVVVWVSRWVNNET